MLLVGFNLPLSVRVANTASRREDRLGSGLYANCPRFDGLEQNAVIEIVGMEALPLEHAVDSDCTLRIPLALPFSARPKATVATLIRSPTAHCVSPSRERLGFLNAKADVQSSQFQLLQDGTQTGQGKAQTTSPAAHGGIAGYLTYVRQLGVPGCLNTDSLNIRLCRTYFVQMPAPSGSMLAIRAAYSLRFVGVERPVMALELHQ